MFKIQKFDLLLAIYIFCILASELMGGKTFPLLNIFGYQLNASVAILILPFIFTANDMVTEVFGKERAKSLVRSGLVVVVLNIIFAALATALEPSARFAGTEAAYDKIFSTAIRISGASLIAFALAEFLDVYIFAKLREKLGQAKLWFRNNLSNFVSQLTDTVIFMTLAFWAFDKGASDNVLFLVSLILPYWLLKCAMSVIETPLVYLGVKWLRKN